MSNLMLDVGQANELKLAFRRHDFTSEEVKRLSEGDFLGRVRDVLRGVRCITKPDFPTWRTVRLGVHRTVDKFTAALKQGGNKVTDWARDIMSKPAFTLAEEEHELQLVKVSGRQLGFTENTRFDRICDRAKELGLKLCPAEVGPALREQYPDQPSGEQLMIAMEAITDSGGRAFVFSVDRDDSERWLDADFGFPGDVWRLGDEFVFCK